MLSLIRILRFSSRFFFFFNDTATTEIYTLSLHDALPICRGRASGRGIPRRAVHVPPSRPIQRRSEEHTSELQSRPHLVCRLLLEKKKRKPWQTSRASSSTPRLSSMSDRCRSA